MSNINDDEREGYGTSGGIIGRNCAQLASGAPVDGNCNDLVKNSQSISGADEVKNIIPI